MRQNSLSSSSCTSLLLLASVVRVRAMDPSRPPRSDFDEAYEGVMRAALRGAMPDSGLDVAAEGALAAVAALATPADQAALVGEFDQIWPQLREALACVPASARSRVELSVRVWDALTQDVEELFPREPGAPLGDAEAENMGDFWFSVAVGQVRPSVGEWRRRVRERQSLLDAAAQKTKRLSGINSENAKKAKHENAAKPAIREQLSRRLLDTTLTHGRHVQLVAEHQRVAPGYVRRILREDAAAALKARQAADATISDRLGAPYVKSLLHWSDKKAGT
jgi:hypothetical protein